ncbi:MAG: cytochrome c family protein [Pseudomonadota bacterium]
MTKKLIIILTLTLFVLLPFAMAMADDGPTGNNRKGKYTYRKVCKACAEAGEIESATPKISPADKKKAEWKLIFENKKFDEFGCLTHWAALSDEDVNDIYSYFYSFAADSPTPATCK